jgi:Tol biopolymer transport system component
VPLSRDDSPLRSVGAISDWSPSWSPDGRFLYFVSNRGGTADLWRVPIGNAGVGGAFQRITTGLQMRDAALSKSGAKVVYSKGQRIAASNVWRMPLRTDRPGTFADARQLTFDDAYSETVDVSPDGKTLALSSSRTGVEHLWTMPASGGEPLQLTTGDAPDWDPRWSPDGTQIVWVADLVDRK